MLRWLFPPLFILSAACSNQAPSPQPTQAVARPVTQAPPGVAERLIDPGQPIAPPVAPAPATTFANNRPDLPKVKTPSDERLPSWVPKSGRLSVISSVDHAKNLGLDDDSAAQPTSTTNISSATWLPRNGRVTTARTTGRSIRR